MAKSKEVLKESLQNYENKAKGLLLIPCGATAAKVSQFNGWLRFFPNFVFAVIDVLRLVDYFVTVCFVAVDIYPLVVLFCCGVFCCLVVDV